MTDLASKSETEGESGAPTSVDAAATTVIASDTAAPLEWAPAEPAKRSAGVMVSDVAQLVDKLKNVAKVI